MIKKNQFLSLIREGDFKELFISELGWDNYKGNNTLPSINVDNVDFNISAIADRSGFQVLYSEVDQIPTQSQVKKIDHKLYRQACDYICIFRLRNTAHDLWVVPVRTNEKRDLVMVEYTDANAEVLYQKIHGLSFEIGEKTTILDVRSKVQGTFAINSEKITKDFYAGFKKQHTAFAEFITGIDDHIETKKNRNKQWYASVMLNRLMFCYFIQKKGFLNLDVDYLRNKLIEVVENEGNGKFYNFYLSFLRRLFHDGLNSSKHSPEFESVFGKIPYLNGGMFDNHQLESEYADIDIPDEAFKSLFDFFDKWNWHLDTRLTASGRDINPDVLGYIFEQYINDRAQMGAYYTKEDITEYIGRNCILPHIFDKVKTASEKASSDDFASDGFVWNSLRDSGDRYIFDAVKKGYQEFAQIPSEISKGIITDEMREEYSETPVGELPDTHIPLAELRSDWNTPTPERWGLPNEIWRETVERLQRCNDLTGKIKHGEITSINDFITYNLDIRSFANDLLSRADSRFVKRFYDALKSVTILDPTCGSGAFLFAAMNILEPLYEICIDRMQEFNRENPAKFKDELEEITAKYRSNIQYFIFKSIILRNLYGVDIMAEATEIAKLRLFLKMVAVVDVDRRADNLGLDPLPDIDFNVRCGNTLVGYATKEQLDQALNDNQGSIEVGEANRMLKDCIAEETAKIARTFEIFKDVQLKQDEDMAAFKEAKHNLRQQLASLNDKLNRRLFLESHAMEVATDEDFTQTPQYRSWLDSHQPFHWLSEFYQIIEGNHGFDVIIGNPPYVVYNKKDTHSNLSIKDRYECTGCKTLAANNLYVFTLERSLSLSATRHIGFIVPLSFGSGKNNSSIRLLTEKCSNLFMSSYEIRPAKLFDGGGGAEQRLNIIITTPSLSPKVFTTKVKRWAAEDRPLLFSSIFYVPSIDERQIWRFSSTIETTIKKKFDSQKSIQAQFPFGKGYNLHYRSAGLRYWIIFSNTDFDSASASNKYLSLSNKIHRDNIFCALSSNLYWWYYACNFDMFNQTVSNIEEFKITLSSSLNFRELAESLDSSQKKNRVKSVTNKKDGSINTTYAYDKKQSKSIIDEIDTVLARHYGFSDEELDFIINYDIKYRMGDELNNTSE